MLNKCYNSVTLVAFLVEGLEAPKRYNNVTIVLLWGFSKIDLFFSFMVLQERAHEPFYMVLSVTWCYINIKIVLLGYIST